HVEVEYQQPFAAIAQIARLFRGNLRRGKRSNSVLCCLWRNAGTGRRKRSRRSLSGFGEFLKFAKLELLGNAVLSDAEVFGLQSLDGFTVLVINRDGLDHELARYRELHNACIWHGLLQLLRADRENPRQECSCDSSHAFLPSTQRSLPSSSESES